MHQRTAAIVVVLGISLSAGLIAAADPTDRPRTETYYDGKQVKVDLRELEPTAAAAILARNSPLYSVYSAEGCEPEGDVFVKVIDNITSDGTSTLWRGVQIEFNPGYPCHQFVSDEQIIAAVNSGEISLNPTGYVYRCRVVTPEE